MPRLLHDVLNYGRPGKNALGRGVRGAAELAVKTGAAQCWANLDRDIPTIAEWFEKHVARK